MKSLDGEASDSTDREKQALKSFEISEVLDPKEDQFCRVCLEGEKDEECFKRL